MKQIMTCLFRAAHLLAHTGPCTVFFFFVAIFEAQSVMNRAITSNYFVPLQQIEGDLPIVTLQLD